MIAKKSSKADLENKRFAFFQIGLIVAGSLTLAAFEYTTVKAEEKKVTLVQEEQGTYIFEPMITEDIPVERPEPQRNVQQSALVMRPIEDVTIVKTPLNPDLKYTTEKIIFTEPCTDCVGTGIVEEPEGKIYEIVDKDPSFPGGETAMAEFIKAHVEYPEMLIDMKIGGMAYVEFVVNEDGSISQVITRSDIHKDLKAEAERVVKMMPAWT